MKMKTNLSLIILMLLSKFIYSQSDMQFKTTDAYYVDITLDGKHKESVLTTWEVDLGRKMIVYKKGEEKKFCFFTKDELVKNEDDEITIEFENSNEVIYFSSYCNYIKLSHYSKMDATNSPRSYKKVITYTNYKLNRLIEVMNRNIK